jgi:hypothetical protein
MKILISIYVAIILLHLLYGSKMIVATEMADVEDYALNKNCIFAIMNYNINF